MIRLATRTCTPSRPFRNETYEPYVYRHVALGTLNRTKPCTLAPWTIGRPIGATSLTEFRTFLSTSSGGGLNSILDASISSSCVKDDGGVNRPDSGCESSSSRLGLGNRFCLEAFALRFEFGRSSSSSVGMLSPFMSEGGIFSITRPAKKQETRSGSRS